MIDIHAHVLPGIDDGARSMEESVKMLQKLASFGFQGVIATPHYSRRRMPEGLKELAAELQQRVRAFSPDFCVYLGQEVYYHEELTSNLKQGRALPMAGSRYVLVEFEPGTPYKFLYQGLRRLSEAGYRPILAHLERYECLHREECISELIKNGSLMQMNYESLQGKWFDREVRRCRRMVEERWIDFLGTDMHRTDYRPPEIGEALSWLRKHVSPEYLDRLTRSNPKRIICREAIN